jgi:hypothetical protein
MDVCVWKHLAEKPEENSFQPVYGALGKDTAGRIEEEIHAKHFSLRPVKIGKQLCAFVE